MAQEAAVDCTNQESYQWQTPLPSPADENKLGKAPLCSRSNSPAAAALPPSGQKRARNGMPKTAKGAVAGEDRAIGSGESDEHEVHIWTERERRKKMRDMFTNLHALLPQLPSKADKSAIVDEAVKYIQTLQSTLQKLQKQKQDRARGYSLPADDPPSVRQTPVTETREAYMADHQEIIIMDPAANNGSGGAGSSGFHPKCLLTWSSPNVVVSVAGHDAHISVCCARRPGMVSMLAQVMEKYKLDVVTAQVYSDESRCMCMIHVHATGVGYDQYGEMLSVEDMFKLAAGQIILWTSS